MSVYSRFSSTPPQVAHHGIKHSRNVRRTHPSERSAARNSYTASQEWRQANPEFDEIQLDENYYQSLGLSAEELADQLGFSASDADPLGQDFGPEGPADGQLDAGSFLMDEDRNEATWGPQVRLTCNSIPKCCLYKLSEWITILQSAAWTCGYPLARTGYGSGTAPQHCNAPSAALVNMFSVLL